MRVTINRCKQAMRPPKFACPIPKISAVAPLVQTCGILEAAAIMQELINETGLIGPDSSRSGHPPEYPGEKKRVSGR